MREERAAFKQMRKLPTYPTRVLRERPADVLEKATVGGETVVFEHGGDFIDGEPPRPVAVLMPYGAYAELVEHLETMRRFAACYVEDFIKLSRPR